MRLMMASQKKRKGTNMSYGCPNGHIEGIEQGCRLTVWLPVNAETGETDTDILDGRETDGWEHGYYYCPICQENFDHLVEVRLEPEKNPPQHR
jgi:hypothetical protein